MDIWASARTVRLATRLRTWLLVAIALLISHDAAYVAQYGIGGEFSRAMTEQGHDGYWLGASLAATILGGIVLALGIRRLISLRRDASGLASVEGPAYGQELSAIWIRLLPIVAMLFTVQENVEHVLTHGGHLVGLGPLLSNLPALAATTFVLAVVGAMVRWHVRRLELRARAAQRPRPGRVVSTYPPREWTRLAAAVPHGWTINRPDAGRAPPTLLAV